MSEPRNPPQHDDRAGDWRPAKAIALLNYAEALQQYLDEQLPGLWPGRGADMHDPLLGEHLVALDALALVTSLLTAVGAGKQVNAAECNAVLIQAKAAFAESGMVSGDRLAGTDSQHEGDGASAEGTGWSLPRWCVQKLCDGMEALSSEAPETRGTEPQG